MSGAWVTFGVVVWLAVYLYKRAGWRTLTKLKYVENRKMQMGMSVSKSEARSKVVKKKALVLDQMIG